LGEVVHTLWKNEYGDEAVRIFRHTLETGEAYETPERAEYRIDRNKTEYYEWRVDRIALPEGGYGVVCYFKDISERVKTRIALREQEERLRKAEKIAAAGQLAASLAHEINNPLSSVTNALYLLNEDPALPDEASRWAKTASNELARVSRIVKQSLSYYRIGTVPKQFDLSALVEESLQIFSEKFRRAGVQVITKIESGSLVIGFADEVRQIIDNLLLNAVEAMSNGGRLAISVHPSRNWTDQEPAGIRLTIADTGSGIPKENLSRIFEPFFTTKPEKGTGLGLWVVRGIVAKHDGIIRMRSSTGKKSGTVVSVLWPAFSREHRAQAPA
jgi:signal transduction histidine kinase